MSAAVDRADLDARLSRHLAAALVRAIRAEDEKAATGTGSTGTSTSSRPAA